MSAKENNGMDNKENKKTKTRKTPTKPRSGKKKKTEGPSCSMFMVELSRKLAQKKKEEQEAPINVVAGILDSLTNALPVVFTKASPVKIEPPVEIETLQSIAPELGLSDVQETVHPEVETSDVPIPIVPISENKKKFKIPKMPVVSSDVFKQIIEVQTADVGINTNSNHDMAGNLAKYVDTLKKISLIAEEFNQKTAKNLKEIVDSVQEDLQQKLEDLVNEQKRHLDQPLQVVQEDIEHASSS